jgi:serine/threonine-protein kinase
LVFSAEFGVLGALPAEWPPASRNDLKRCLEKDPKQRVQAIGDVRLAIAGAFDEGIAASPQPVATAQRQIWQRPIPLALAALAALLVGAVALRPFLSGSREAAPSTKRVLVAVSDSDQMGGADLDVLPLSLAFTPDGQTLVYRAARDGAVQLFRRPLAQFEATPLPGTENGVAPFVSPDGQWIGFAAPGGLFTVALAGGPPQPLVESPELRIGGADWGTGDVIVYGINRAGGGLMQIRAAGGDPTPLFTPEDRRRSLYPQILPGGDAVLFTLSDPPGESDLHLLAR